MENKFFGIRMKIVTIMLIVTILPIGLISFISYKSSSNMMTDQYRELGITIGTEITDGISIKMEDMENALTTLSTSSELSNDFINFINTYKTNNTYFVGEGGNILFEGQSGMGQSDIDVNGDWYKRVIDSPEDKVIWGNIQQDKSGGYYVTMSKGAYSNGKLIGVLGVDVPVTVFDDILSDKRIGTSGFPILVDANAFKLALKDTAEIGVEFKGKENFEDMPEDSKAVRNQFERDGVVQHQFMIINKVKDTGWHMVTIVPINNIKERTSEMLKLILLVGAITIILGVATAVLFSKSIIVPLKKILLGMDKMGLGDFSEKIIIKNTDEFGQLRDGCNQTMNTLSMLIANVRGISEEVSISSETLAAVSEETSASGEEISRTSEEIALGASNQADEIECSSRLINNLSEKIVDLSENSRTILDSVVNVNETIDRSNVIVHNLSTITKENFEKTEDVSVKLDTLDNKIGEIGGILSTIDAIAEQTNLLALNASIEAARAGESGKGFAVVAEEIRKLAGESGESSSIIKNIIEGIQIESKETVQVMESVKEASREQESIVIEVDNAFDDLSKAIESITSMVGQVGVNIEDINSDKDEVVFSIDNILAVSEETAAASEEVSASMDQQSKATVEVSNAAEKLNELSRQLNEEISKFKS